MGTNSCFVFQNILFYVLDKNETHKDLEQHEGGKMMTNFSFLGELSF